MPLPLRRKRCSFGGKEGVWWRRKSTSTVDPTRTTPHTQPVMTTTNDDEKAVGAVYHRTSCQNHVSSSSSEESGDDNTLSFALELERPKQRRRRLPKRRKTFGGLSRRPLSLLLSNENNLFSSTKSRERETSTAQRTSPDPAVNLDPRPDVQHNPQPSQPRRKDIESTQGRASDSFHFPSDSEELDRWDTPKRPTATSSIQQAQEYFAHLDSAHHLQIDSSFSPIPCRPITRTTRTVQLSSPGFVNEYTKYANASRDLGIMPLPTRVYAKGRRRFFRKAEL